MPADWCAPDSAAVDTSLAGLNRMFKSFFSTDETGTEENIEGNATRWAASSSACQTATA